MRLKFGEWCLIWVEDGNRTFRHSEPTVKNLQAHTDIGVCGRSPFTASSVSWPSKPVPWSISKPRETIMSAFVMLHNHDLLSFGDFERWY